MEKEDMNRDFFYFQKKLDTMDKLPYILFNYSENEFFEKMNNNSEAEISLHDFAKTYHLDEMKLQRTIEQGNKKEDLGIAFCNGLKFRCKYFQMSCLSIIIEIQAIEDEKWFLELVDQNNKEAISILKVTEHEVNYLYHNFEHSVLTGFDNHQIRGKKLDEVLGELYYKKFEEEIMKCSKNAQTSIFQAKACWNGQVVERLCRLDPIQEDTSYVMASELEMDMVKKWIAENHLSLTKFDEMFHSHQSVMLLIEPNSGQIIDANPAASHFYGYSNEELTSMTIQKINTLLDDDVKRKRDSAVTKDCQYFLFRHRLKSGEMRLVDVHSSPIEINEHKYLFSIISDATERESNEEELYKEKELQKTTMDSIADGVVTTDLNGQIQYMNKAAEIAIEWKLNDVIGKKFEEIFFMSNELTM